MPRDLLGARARSLTRPPLQASLPAAVLALLAAGAAALVAAAHLAVAASLSRSADRDLRSYAASLSGRSFAVFPHSRMPPGAAAFGGDALSLEIRDGPGRPVLAVGPVARRGPAVVVPVRFRARHILYAFGADDTSFTVSGRGQPGMAGTLVIGLDPARADLAVARLTVVLIVLSCAVIGAAVAALAWMLHVLLARALSRTRGLADQAAAVLTVSERAASGTAERLRQALADTCTELRRPLSIVAGLAARYVEHCDRFRDTERGRVAERLAVENARMSALVDELADRVIGSGSR